MATKISVRREFGVSSLDATRISVYLYWMIWDHNYEPVTGMNQPSYRLGAVRFYFGVGTENHSSGRMLNRFRKMPEWGEQSKRRCGMMG